MRCLSSLCAPCKGISESSLGMAVQLQPCLVSALLAAVCQAWDSALLWQAPAAVTALTQIPATKQADILHPPLLCGFSFRPNRLRSPLLLRSSLHSTSTCTLVALGSWLQCRLSAAPAKFCSTSLNVNPVPSAQGMNRMGQALSSAS